MAKIIDQLIPAEILDSYTKLLLPAKTDGHINGTVEKRPPFEQPTWRGFIGNLPTERQIFVRQCFKRSTICFGCQPQTGGVEPPDIGPRSREWWYNECGAYDVDYYRYFMHETIPPYFDGWTPDWCKNSPAIGYKTIISGEYRNPYWGEVANTFDEAWEKTLEVWKNCKWTDDAGHTEINLWGFYDWWLGKPRAWLNGYKTTATFDLKNLPGGDDWKKVKDAWFEITATLPTPGSYSGALSITPGGNHSWQPYFEIACPVGNFGNAAAEFFFEPTGNGENLKPEEEPPEGEKRIKGGYTNLNSIKIRYLLSN